MRRSGPRCAIASRAPVAEDYNGPMRLPSFASAAIATVSVVALVCVSACASSQVAVSTGARSAASSSVVSGGSVSVHAHGGSGLATVLVAIALLAGMVEHAREEHPAPRLSDLVPGNTTPVPEMAPERRIAEQDCTQPIDFSAGNLRCK